MTLAVLVPVKDLSRAKTRLANLLSQPERAELAAILLRGVLETIARIDPAAAADETPQGAVPQGETQQEETMRRVVVTAHAPSAALARSLGFEVLAERRQVSESDSVDQASAQLQREGVRGVLRVPLDLPLIERGDLERLLMLARQGCPALLVPSLSGTGTNALYRSPPTLFPSRFGPGSLALHEQEARRVTADVRIVPLASLALDIDDPEDVRELLSRGQRCPALDYLQERGGAERLERIGKLGAKG